MRVNWTMSLRSLGLLLVLFIVACAPAEDTASTAGTPFLGGSQGVILSFVENAPPGTVYDGNTFPFDIVVKAENKGEFPVPKNKIFVDILGFEPGQFGKGASDLSRAPKENMEARGKDAQGNILESNPTYVEFTNLKYRTPIAGAELSFPIKAEACYLYGTIATTKLCARENVLQPGLGGLCEINADKEVFNSGAPVQITSLVESARAQDKIAFTFKISHVGTGKIFEKGALCSTETRGHEDKVFVEISSPMQGVTCSGLGESTGPQGFATLYSGSATITCTQPLTAPRDYEFPVTITVTYDYRDSISTNLVVKHTVG